MSDTPTQKDQTRPGRPTDPRKDRLKAALKANLARRKAQARVRKGDDGTPRGASQEPDGQG